MNTFQYGRFYCKWEDKDNYMLIVIRDQDRNLLLDTSWYVDTVPDLKRKAMKWCDDYEFMSQANEMGKCSCLHCRVMHENKLLFAANALRIDIRRNGKHVEGYVYKSDIYTKPFRIHMYAKNAEVINDMDCDTEMQAIEEFYKWAAQYL